MTFHFQTLYQSPWHHPGVALLCAGVSLLLLLASRHRQPSGFRRLYLLLTLAIVADALLTGALSPLPSGGWAATAAAVGGVILGDLRYFYLVERQRQSGSQGGRLASLVAALQVAMVVPILTAIGQALWPQLLYGNRLFLLYELSLLGILLGHYGRRRRIAGRRGDYVRRLLAFELCQYGLWAAADVLILCGSDLGWGLRLLPNGLYYGAFVPFALLGAPPEAQA
jgi:hypothetical protein